VALCVQETAARLSGDYQPGVRVNAQLVLPPAG
jgi:hypothetical protein